jgi:hypothetical protein
MLFATLLFAACGGPDIPDGPAARAGLSRGNAAAARWTAAARNDSIDATTAIALGYLERQRLGLGSPFRLIDYATHDPRLADSTRITLGWSLLSRTLQGEGYEVDGAALDRAGAGATSMWPGLGVQHLALITDAITESRDPRSGELAVRLGYALAATEGSLPSHAPTYAARAAALVRDRELARRDAADLLRAAETSKVPALQLLQQWRAERRFAVESPTLAALPQDAEGEALEIAPHIAAALRELGSRTELPGEHAPVPDVNRSLLTPVAARRLLQIADSARMPPIAPIVIGVRGFHDELVAQPWLTPDERERRHALEKAGTEERFVAEYALLERRSAHDVIPSLVALWSAVGMRTLAQEPVWYPGYAAPSSRELMQRYGLSSITFGASVPTAWRPYYRRMLDGALTDLRLVLPALDLHGLGVRFAELDEGAGTLALHDPKRRMLLLPPSTAAGTLTHEIAHDLDWQVATRRYHVRGDYASDRAVRTGAARGDRLALRMQDLSVGIVQPETKAPQLIAHARRPAEILARNIDWFVTATLAGQGRVDGYLSSVQDELLTGYGTVRAPELTGVAADALMTILDDIAPTYPRTRDWFLRNYGSNRSLRSYDLARRVMEAEIPEDSRAGAGRGIAADMRVFDGIAHARQLGEQAIDAWICRAPGGAYNAELEDARRTLVARVASARARGYAVRRARALMGRPAENWVAAQLVGAPWHAEDLSDGLEEYLGELVAGARSVEAPPHIARQDGFELNAIPSECR